MEQTLREKALNWWAELFPINRATLGEKYFASKHPSTLNAADITYIYYEEHQQDKQLSPIGLAAKNEYDKTFVKENQTDVDRSIFIIGAKFGSEWQKESNASEWELALISLTPSGSEFCGDSKRCVEFVRDFNAGQHKQIVDLTVSKKALIDSHNELLEAFKEVVRISDRKHDAWDRAKQAIANANKL